MVTMPDQSLVAPVCCTIRNTSKWSSTIVTTIRMVIGSPGIPPPQPFPCTNVSSPQLRRSIISVGGSGSIVIFYDHDRSSGWVGVGINRWLFMIICCFVDGILVNGKAFATGVCHLRLPRRLRTVSSLQWGKGKHKGMCLQFNNKSTPTSSSSLTSTTLWTSTSTMLWA